MIYSISKKEAQKLILHAQGLPSVRRQGSALSATLSAVERLSYIQIDTISAVQRAHHHTLWTRNPRYKISHLDELLKNKQIFEYWSHAAAYLPMRDYRYSLIRKKAIAQGELDHWYERDHPLMDYVLKRIQNEGPLMSKDFEGEKKLKGEWSYKPAKRALEYLFMQGELMIPKRVNFHKVYDLTERVLPQNINTSLPSEEEYIRFLITSFLRANGLGKASEIGYLRKITRSRIESILQEMKMASEVIVVQVGSHKYYALADSIELLETSLQKSKVKILSPFDNLLIQRKRMKDLFQFDYILECYVPQAKRQVGYFSLPILWDGHFVARMDCKADRKSNMLHVNHLALEPGLKKTDAFFSALSKELQPFMLFNDCVELTLHKITPNKLLDQFRNTISRT